MRTPASEVDRAVLRQALADLHRESWAWALNCCDRNRADAEDVLQTTYLKILDGRARFDGRSSMLTWLFAVIRKSALDARRRRYAHTLATQLLAMRLVEPVAAPAEDALEASQAQRAVVAALRRVSTRQREVLMLVFYHELTVDDAAQVMGVGVGAARQHYARGKRALQALLATPENRP